MSQSLRNWEQSKNFRNPAASVLSARHNLQETDSLHFRITAEMLVPMATAAITKVGHG
jgi:hypothetical protein